MRFPFISRPNAAALRWRWATLLSAFTALAVPVQAQSPTPSVSDSHGIPRTSEEGAHGPAHAQSASPSSEKPLAQYRDKNRVLLVFAPTAQDNAYLEQNKFWRNEKSDFEERQIVVVPVLADARAVEGAAGTAPAVLEKKYGVEPRGFAVVLIGKDGRDAFRAGRPVKADILYGIIDAMPLRRTEMKRPPAATPTPTPKRPDLDHDE